MLAACSELLGEPNPSTGAPSPQPWEPAAGDDKLIRGEVSILETELQSQASDPTQYVLFLSGTLPTPCHHLRVNIPEPDEKNQIQVEVFSLVDPADICIQMLEPFEINIPLENYSSGNYAVFVNGRPVSKLTP